MTAKRYEASENMILKLRKKYPLNAMITIQHMDVYISQGRYDEATRIGRSLLQINHEDIIAYLRLTGIELDQEKKYESALDYVEQAMAIDADDTYVMAVKKILVHHYLGQINERDALIELMKKKQPDFIQEDYQGYLIK